MQGCENAKIYYLKVIIFWERYSILMRKITEEYSICNKIKRNAEKRPCAIILDEGLHYRYMEDAWEIEKQKRVNKF